MNEKILKYTWVEFLKTPFSLFFFAVTLALCVFVYLTLEDKKEAKNELLKCNESRLKDMEVYKNLILNIKIGSELKKDTVK